MPKISEITYKNELSDFINYNAIKSEVDTAKASLNKVESDELKVLKTELTSGGLDLYAVNINGVPILHTEATNIYNEISAVFEEINNVIDNFERKTKRHRIAELDAYIRALTDRITKLTEDMEYYNNLAADYKRKNNKQNYGVYKGKAEECQKELEGGFFSIGLREKLIDATNAKTEMSV